MEFVNAVKKASDEGYTVYSPDTKTADSILKEYYPEAYGDRKLLSYPIGQFLYTLSQMWEDDVQEAALSPDDLMKCVSSGWLSADGESAVYVWMFLFAGRTAGNGPCPDGRSPFHGR